MRTTRRCFARIAETPNTHNSKFLKLLSRFCGARWARFQQQRRDLVGKEDKVRRDCTFMPAAV